jgi:photosystem II stability/assembly factor-like uncharacterized protein
MRAGKVLLLLLIAGGVAFAGHRLTRKAAPPPAPRPAQGKVQLLSSAPRHEAGSYDLGDVALVEGGAAWAVGYDGRHTRRVYRSADGGGAWQPVEVPGNGATLRALSFADARHGWAVGGLGLVVRTSDGGQTWEALDPRTDLDLEAVHFVDERVGYVGASEKMKGDSQDEVVGSLEILCTKDGGASWRRCHREAEPGSVFQIASASESVAVAVLDGNRLLRTEDAGGTWARVPFSARYVTSVAFAPDGTGWAVGPQGAFQTSPDAGKSWLKPASLPEDFSSRDWAAVAFDEAGKGLAVGKAGALALTSDGGKTWELLPPPAADDLRGVRLHDSSALILGARSVYRLKL